MTRSPRSSAWEQTWHARRHRLPRPLLRAGDGPGGWRARRVLRGLIRRVDAVPVDPLAAMALAKLAATAPPDTAPPASGRPATEPVDAPDADGRSLGAGAPREVAAQVLLRAVTRPDAGAADGAATARVYPIVEAAALGWIVTRHPALLDVLVAAAAPPAAVWPAMGWDAAVPLLLLLRGVAPAHAPPGVLVEALAVRHPEGLVDALDDEDPRIRAAAADALRATSQPRAVSALAERCRWETRQDRLDLLAASPGLPTWAYPRLLTAAVRGWVDIVAEFGTDAVPLLVDLIVQAAAPAADVLRRTLRSLSSPDAREYVCRVAIGLAVPTSDRTSKIVSGPRLDEVRAAALDAGYLPAADPDRALFLFLTERWDRYAQLDADGRLLSAAYAGADPATRLRLRAAARASGQGDALRLVVGGDLADRAARLSQPEAAYVIDALAADGRLGEAWRLVLDLPFRWALAGSARLARAGFSPGHAEDAALFAVLRDAAARVDDMTLLDWASATEHDFIRQVGDIRCRGHIFGVSFAPDGAQLAFGTTGPGVGLWDLATRRLLWMRHGFAGAIGPVRHVGDGTVYAAETTQGGGVYLVDASGHRRLGEHAGPVTAMAALPGGGVVTASRDGTVAFWDEDGQQGDRLHLDESLLLSLAVAPDGAQLVVGHRGLTRYRLPSRRLIGALADGPYPSQSVGFSTDGVRILAGGLGTVTVYDQLADGQLRESRAVLLDHNPGAAGGVLEVAPLTRAGGVLVATQVGWVHEYRWPDWSEAHPPVQVRPGLPPLYSSGRTTIEVTSAAVSGCEAILALGHRYGVISLWDLRAAGVRRALTRPPAEATRTALDAVEGASWLPESAALAALLRHRFRYDIHLGSPAAGPIRAGRHDIELG